MHFNIHTVDSAPEGAKGSLAQIADKYGFIPNLAGVFAESPGAMQGLLAALAAYDSPELKLSPVERQVVLLTVSVDNRCTYCTAAHSMLLDMHGLARSEIDQVQNGEPMQDSRLESLRRFTLAVVTKQGQVTDEDTSAFAKAGYSNGEVLEVVQGVALKTLTNYANHIAKPAVNEQFSAYLPQWPQAA